MLVRKTLTQLARPSAKPFRRVMEASLRAGGCSHGNYVPTTILGASIDSKKDKYSPTLTGLLFLWEKMDNTQHANKIRKTGESGSAFTENLNIVM